MNNEWYDISHIFTHSHGKGSTAQVTAEGERW